MAWVGKIVLPLAALVIAALVAYKLNQPPRPHPPLDAALRSPAIPFEMFDQDSKLFRLSRYLGRHKLVIVFYIDAESGEQLSPLERLRREAEEIKKSGVYFVAVSAATPYAHREAIKRVFGTKSRMPFPLLSDPTFAIHQQWGAFDRESGRALEATFVVDRAGRICWSRIGPEPFTEVPVLIQAVKDEG